MIELIKGLLNISDNSKDGILNHCLSKAESSIKHYLNYDDVSEFQTQIVDLAIFYYKNMNNQGIIQQSQGSRSQTFERGIPKEIIQSLPLPRVKVIG